MKIRCNICSEPVSTEVPDGPIFRGWVECPECVEKNYTRNKEDVRQEIERLDADVEKFKNDERMLTWIEGQLKSLYWMLGSDHINAVNLSNNHFRKLGIEADAR